MSKARTIRIVKVGLVTLSTGSAIVLVLGSSRSYLLSTPIAANEFSQAVGADINAHVGSEITLSAAIGPTYRLLQHTWRQVEGPERVLDTSTERELRFTVNHVGMYEFALTVSEAGQSRTYRVQVLVNNEDGCPPLQHSFQLTISS